MPNVRLAITRRLCFPLHMQKPSRDMPLVAFWIGIGLLALSWLYPPRTAVIGSRPFLRHEVADSWWVFGPDQVWTDDRTFQIDIQGLLGIDFAIAAVAGSAIISLRFERKKAWGASDSRPTSADRPA